MLPNPVMPSDGIQYKAFYEVYGKATTEKHMPSLHNARKEGKHGLRVSACAQTLVYLPVFASIVTSHVYSMVLHATTTLNKELQELGEPIEWIKYSCGAKLDLYLEQELDATDNQELGDVRKAHILNR